MARPCTNDDSWIKRKIQAIANGIAQQGQMFNVPRFFAMMSLSATRIEERQQTRYLRWKNGRWRGELIDALCDSRRCDGKWIEREAE